MISASPAASFSTELSPALVDSAERPANNRWQFSRLTRPCRSKPAMPRRRKAAPLDPRRSPETLRPPGCCRRRAAEESAALPARPADSEGGIAAGVAVLRAALRNVPASPGVYRMLDRKGDAVYVGKARNLKSRVQNYTHPAGLSNRLRRMVAETATFEIVVTDDRGRGAVARMQPDQAADAALQRAAARRQVVPVHPPDRRPRSSRSSTKFRGARDKPGIVFRAVRLGRRGQPHAGRAAEGVPAALVQRQPVRQPHPALPALPDQALQRAVRRPHRRRRLRPADGAGDAVPVGAQPGHPAAPRRARWTRPPRRSISRRRR